MQDKDNEIEDACSGSSNSPGEDIPLLPFGQGPSNKPSSEDHPSLVVEPFNKSLIHYFKYTYAPWRRLVMNEITRGANEFFSWFWAPSFYTLLLHDLITDGNEDEGYGNTLGDIFARSSDNQQTWSTQLGDDIIGPEFILLYAFLILSPILYSTGNYLLHLRWRSPINSDELDLAIDRIENSYFPIAINSISRLKWEIWQPFFTEHNELKEKEEQPEVVQDVSNEIANKTSLDKIVQMKMRAGLVGINQLQLLAHVALSVGVPSDIRNNAVKKIEEEANLGNFRLKDLLLIPKLKANYLLWTVGDVPTEGKRNKLKHLVFSTYFLLKNVLFIYALFRYSFLTVSKTIDIIVFLVKQSQCTDDHKLWSYIWPIAEYDCSVCGDWSFVYLPWRYQAQGCLDGLLSSKLNENEIIHRLDRLVDHPDISRGITAVDLSKQAIVNWNENNFRRLLQKFPSNQPLEEFNLSAKTPDSIWPNDTKINAITEFMQQHPIEAFSLRNQKLDSQFIPLFFQTLNHTDSGAKLDLGYTNIGNEALIVVGRTLPFLQTSELILDGCLATEDGWVEFADNLQSNSTLISIHLKKVVLTQRSFDALNAGFTRMGIKELILDETDLSSLDMTSLCNVLTTLETLSLKSCHIEDDPVITLSNGFRQSPLTSCHLEKNSITSYGGVMLCRNLNGTQVHTLDLGDNLVDGQFLRSVTPFLPQSAVKSLRLANNDFKPSDFNYFILGLGHASLEEIDVTGTNFDDENLINLSISKSNFSLPLRSFILSSTSITSRGMLVFLQLTKSDECVELDVSSNLFNKQIFKCLSNFLESNSYLQKLNLADTSMEPADAHQMSVGFNRLKAPLHTFIIDNNELDTSSFNSIIDTFITPISQMDRLGNADISSDQRRALANAESNTKLTTFSAANVGVDTFSARKIIRFLPHTTIPLHGLNLQNNDGINTNEVDVENGVVSAASHLSSWFKLDFFQIACSHLLVNSYDSLWNQPVELPRLSSASNQFAMSLVKASCHYEETVDTRVGLMRKEPKAIRSVVVPDFSGILMLGFYALFLVHKGLQILPYHQDHPLTKEDRERLRHCQKALNRIRQTLIDQSQSYLGRSGLVEDEMNYGDKQVHSVTKHLRYALKQGELSEAKLVEFETKIERIKEFIHRHAKQNHTLKQFLAKEKYLKAQGVIFTSTIRRNVVTGELKHHIAEINAEPASAAKKVESYCQSALNYFCFWQRNNRSDQNNDRETSLTLSSSKTQLQTI